MPGPLFRREPGMIRLRLNPILIQTVGHAFRCLPALAINDPALFRTRLNIVKHLIIRLGFGNHPIRQVGPVKTGHITTRIAQFQMRHDITPDSLSRSGCKCHHRHVRKVIAQFSNLPIFRSEIMSPFADAMRLINCEKVDLPLFQILQKPGEHQALRGNIEEPKFPGMQSAQSFASLASGKCRIQESRSHATGLQRINLILHQRNQRRDDNGEPGPDQGWELETERFTATRWKQGKDIPPGQRIINNLLLQRSK